MKTSLRIAIILVVAGLVAGAVALKKDQNQAATPPGTPAPPSQAPATVPSPAVPTAPQNMPKLLDLGATKCIPCIKMAPILEQLRKDYAGRMEVEFIDVWQNPDAARQYGIRLIPTQIFFDANGKELFRHEGFFGREDILGKWKELGVAL